MPPPPKPKAPTSIPHLEHGDEVYFSHPQRGPMSGRVAAFGAHGCTVDAEKERHSVTYDRLLGHKVRMTPKLKVIDDGEDGFLAEDTDGRRRYFHDPLTEEGAETMAKALPRVLLFGAPRQAPEPRVLLFGTSPEMLAKAIANGPGLSLQPVTDKAGHQTKRWKRNGADLPKVKARGQRAEPEDGDRPAKGDVVKFKAGDFHGEGRIVGTPGRDGAQVKDRSGRKHGVLWREMRPVAEKAAAKAAAEAASSKDASAPRVDTEKPSSPPAERPPFPADEIAALPEKAKQPVSSWAELQTKGAEGLAEYKTALGKVVAAMGLRTDLKPDDLTDYHFGSPEGFLFIAPLKDEKRAREKVAVDYDGDWSKLRDVIRATISVNNMDEIRHAVAAVEAAGIKLAQKPNDRFSSPTLEGYRDLMTIVKLPNGMLAELQYHVKTMTKAKAEGYHHYETQRGIVARNKKHPKYDPAMGDAPHPFWSARDRRVYDDSVQKQRAIYDPAWKKASKMKQ